MKTGGWCRMQTWCAVILLIALSACIRAHDTLTVTDGLKRDSPSRDELQQLIKGELNDGKKRLLQRSLNKELRDRDSINVTPLFTWKLGTIKGTAASTFRSFNQSFILSGKILYRIIEGPGPSNYSTEQVAMFPEFLGEVAFMESVEWDGLLILVTAYKEGLLQLFTVAQTNEVILRQSIACYGIPTDAEFFMQDEKLFLIVSAKNGSALVPTTIYRWYGTQLDEIEDNKHLLIEASAVSTFPFRESVIITVAVGAKGSRTAGLEIFQRTGNKLELIQFLPTSQPSALQHYTFHSENYLLVSMVEGPSIICWWAGTEMIIWDYVKHEESIRSVGVGYIRGETLLLLAEKTRIKVFRPTAASFQFIAEHEFRSTVQSASLYSKDNSLSLLAITELDGQMVPYVLELQLVFKAATVNHIPPGLEDPLLKCISELEYRIRSRRSKLQDISSLSKKLLRISSPGSFKGKLVVRKLVPSGASIRNVTLSQESSTTMVMSGSALKNRIQQSSQNALLLSGSLKNVVMKSTPSTLSGRLTTSELTSNLIKMESVHIADLNNRKFDPSTLLMRNKNQKMTGKVTVDTINVGSLTVGRLNHMKIEELLRKSVDHQTISGLQLVKHVKAKKVDLSANIPINGISISHIVTSKSPDVVTVTGTKTLAGLNLQQLAVGLLNNVNFTQWIASLQQNLPTPMPPRYPGTKTYKSTSNLKVHNLTVNGKINGVPINDLLGTLFLKGLNQHIHGDIVYNSELTVQNLHANQFNEIPTASLLTRHTNQIVSGSLLVEGISGNDIIVEKLNGLKLSEEAAYLNSPLPVSTPVTFSSLESHELILPPKASIAGQQVGRRLLHEPKVIYEGTVRVEGELKLMDVNLEQAKVILDGKPVDFKHLQLNYWTKSDQSIHYIQGSSNELHVENLATSTINGHRPENFVSMSTKNLQGTWHFPNATVVGNLDHALSATQSPVSPKELSAIIVKTSGKYEVSGRKLFLGGLTVTHLSTKTLNSKNVADTLGRVKKGRKYQEIWVGGDLIVYSNLTVGSVNKWNICDRLSNALLIDWPGHIPSATIAAVSAININVSTINGIPFNVINGPNPNYVPRVHKVTLKGNVFLPYFKNVQFINNKSVTTDYLDRVVDKTKIAVIRGRKTFASQLKVHGTFDAVDYNGVKLKDLFDNALSKTRDQTILVPIEIQDVVANELQAYQVNNVDVGNLLSTELKSRQVIEGDLLFTSDIDVSGRLTTGHLSTDTSGRDCPLDRVAARLQTLDGRRWSNLIVLGDLTWSKNLAQRVPGLSYYLGSAVTRSSNQIISGEIKFNGNVAVDNFNSLKQINDIDIVGISMDSLRKSLPRQVIHTHTVFMSRLNTSSVTVLGNVNAKVVDGVKIPNFNNSLVRIDGDQKVAGSKRFLQGFTAKLLKVDTVNGLLSTNIACYDQPMLPPIHFQAPVDVKKDFWFETLDGFKFDDFVAQRVTLDSLQHIDGHITFIRDLSIEGEMVAPRINNLDIGDIVQLDSLEEQDIRGKKQFLQSLRVDGPMEVDNLETVSLRMAYSAALFKDENATIFGDLILGNIATMNSNLDVIDSVNSERISNLVRLLGSHTERNLAGVRSIARTINETNLLLEARGDLSELLYLESVADATVSFTNTYKAIERESDGSESVIDVHGWASYAHCGLPETCLCPAQYTIRTAHGIQSKLDIEWRTGLKHNSTQRSFIFHLKNPFVTVIVKTNTVSRDSRCRLRGVDYLQEVTLLSWVEMGSNEVQREFTVNIAPEPIIGYISDVKTIVIGSRIYVIFGIFYNADLDTNNINSVIVHIDRATRKARIVAEFPTRGVLNLDVFSTAKGQHIVVGNSFDSAAQSTKVSLDIYRFNAITEQLTLVKSVPTDSIVSIVSVVQGGDSLIVIAQKQSYAPVMVLKHDPVHDDYHFVQQLNSNTLPNGLGVFYVGQPGVSDAYLGVTTVDDRFYLYKFNHIEGFKHVMQTELKGAQGLSSFSVGSQQYLLVTSTNTPSIFEIVKQSS